MDGPYSGIIPWFQNDASASGRGMVPEQQRTTPPLGLSLAVQLGGGGGLETGTDTIDWIFEVWDKDAKLFLYRFGDTVDTVLGGKSATRALGVGIYCVQFVLV